MRVNGTQYTTLTGEGYGEIRLSFPGKNTVINRITVATSPAIRETVCRVYRDFVGAPYMIDNTYTGGSGDTSDTVHHIDDGHALIITWENGDPDATATVTYSGEQEE